MPVNWLGAAVSAAIKARLGANLRPACDLLAARARSTIATPGPPRSRPGSPPHIDSGALLRSVKAGADPGSLRGYVQADVEHAAYLEEGTRRMAARPWLLPALTEAADDAARELAK
jgi:hypothetical protein